MRKGKERSGASGSSARHQQHNYGDNFFVDAGDLHNDDERVLRLEDPCGTKLAAGMVCISLEVKFPLLLNFESWRLCHGLSDFWCARRRLGRPDHLIAMVRGLSRSALAR